MRLLLASLLLISGSVSAFGILGDTEGDLKARYGEPRRIHMDGPRRRVFYYESHGCRISATVVDQKTKEETYSPIEGNRPFTDAEVQNLLDANGHGERWTRISNARSVLGPESAPSAEAYLISDGEDLIVCASAYAKTLGTDANKMNGAHRQETFVGIAEFRERPGMEARFLQIRAQKNIIVIPWGASGSTELGNAKAGTSYRITAIEEHPDDVRTPMAFVSDREHKDWHDTVDDSIAETLVRVETDTETIFDRAVCEVHHVPMNLKTVEMNYGMFASATDADAFCEAHFPHQASVGQGGCVMGDSSPKMTRIYLCPQCVADCEKYKREHPEESKRTDRPL